VPHSGRYAAKSSAGERGPYDASEGAYVEFVFTRPADLADETIRGALAMGWDFDAEQLTYQAVGFGSHHWKATATSGGARFVTVDDLEGKKRDRDDTPDDVFERLTRAFTTVRALHDDAGLDFSVPPLKDRAGGVIERLGTRYSMVVHSFLDGPNLGEHGEYTTASERFAVLELLIDLHAATDVASRHADVDDLALPHREDFREALSQVDSSWTAGPYGERARALLSANEHSLRTLLVAYERLATEVGGHRDRMVITHGEPHAGNVLDLDGRYRLIDWDTARVAAPERDLWDLDPGDGSILEAYTSATGAAAVPEALSLYRLWYDLDEIGGYLEAFRQPHHDDADAAESWNNLLHFLQPEARWPSLLAGNGPAD
jgi:aminoglycoside phosphotransferase (APT) family kinase protein